MHEPTGSDLEIRPERWRAGLARVRERLRRHAGFAGGAAAAFLAVALYAALFPAPAPLTGGQVDAAIATKIAEATPLPAWSAQAYQAIQPSFVLIQTAGAAGDEEGGSLGSGVVINDAGDILTSLHVVTATGAISVTFADGTESLARISVAQPENDIAVLSADSLPERLAPATLGNPNALAIGDEVFALGNPFGLYGSLSAGVLSARERSFQPEGSPTRLRGLMQIDAAVNPGNSGGPLVNRNGEVVGIIVGIVNPTDQKVFVGIGFAVPITVAGAAAGMPPQ